MKNNRTQNTEYRIQNLKHRRKAGRGLLQALLAIVIVGVGIAGAVIFIKLKKPPERKQQGVQAPLVEVVQLRSEDIRMTVQGYGTVNPKVQVDIIPEVAGSSYSS